MNEIWSHCRALILDVDILRPSEVVGMVVISAVMSCLVHRTVIVVHCSSRFLFIDDRVFGRPPTVASGVAIDLSQCAHPRQRTVSPLTHTRHHSLDVWMTRWRSVQASSWKRFPVSDPHAHTFFRGHASVLSGHSGVFGLCLFFRFWFWSQPPP